MEIAATSGQSEKLQRSTASLTENFDTFLTLLTTQLQNQDPLSPLDTNEFTAQLVQFSSVEQAIQTNQNLENLVSLTQSAAAGSAVGYLGKNVTLHGDTTSLSNGQASWDYTLTGSATENNLVVSDSTGKVVYQAPGEILAGTHTFTWDGKDNNGADLPEGAYSLSLLPLDEAGEKIPSTISVTGPVSTIDMNGTVPLIEVAGVQYPLSDILRIEESAP